MGNVFFLNCPLFQKNLEFHIIHFPHVLTFSRSLVVHHRYYYYVETKSGTAVVQLNVRLPYQIKHDRDK